MKALVIDTAMTGASVTFADFGADHFVTHKNDQPRGQAEYLIPLIEDVMQEVGIGYGELSHIVTTIGPGAFTGLRIGMSAAKSFGLALDIPVHGVTTLDALALCYAEQDRPILVLIETKRKDFYAQVFQDQKPVTEKQALSVQGVLDLCRDHNSYMCIGDAVGRFADEAAGQGDDIARFDVSHDLSRIDTDVLARCFHAHIAGGQYQDIFTSNPDPVYIRPPDVTLSPQMRKNIANAAMQEKNAAVKS